MNIITIGRGNIGGGLGRRCDHAPAGPARVVLAERENAGIKVTLLWAEDTDAVAVLVRNYGVAVIPD